ncbi:MAG: hypothetical protein FWG93_08870 [Oscillospiraceae bacterium]|nr:hypothetical protein [Oscillospiraceae bacterium]
MIRTKRNIEQDISGCKADLGAAWHEYEEAERFAPAAGGCERRAETYVRWQRLAGRLPELEEELKSYHRDPAGYLTRQMHAMTGESDFRTLAEELQAIGSRELADECGKIADDIFRDAKEDQSALLC